MKGHIRERSPGRWAIVIDLHDPETGNGVSENGIHSRVPSGRPKSSAPG